MQWAELTPGQVVVATDERAWIHAPAPGDPFLEPMRGMASLASTRNLLDGALEAGARAVARPEEPPLTPLRWAWRLVWQFHTTHPTAGLMREAAERFHSLGRAEMGECCARKAEEERGHDTLALRDLRALDYDAEALVAACRPPGAAAIGAFFEGCARAENPVGVFGYAYALERFALAVGKDYVAAVEAMFPGIKATRCLRVHSAMGTDVRHVAELAAFITRLPAADRALIAQAACRTARLMHERRPGDEPDEAELARTLDRFILEPINILDP
ncbi:MAG: iron-containing redox enzyme family protein [Armatimonadetes bacterium]|nr:iron-containing redox enzyme family protein [Armatimonadota bacterium]